MASSSLIELRVGHRPIPVFVGSESFRARILAVKGRFLLWERDLPFGL